MFSHLIGALKSTRNLNGYGADYARMRKIQLFIRNKSYAKIIAVYNNKGLCSVVEREFGIRDYYEKALEYLKIAPEQVVGTLRELFPSELTSNSD